MKIIMLKGLPGSGKSTYARELCEKDRSYVRVNKDDLRAMMGKYRAGKDEEMILQWRDLLVTRALTNGKSVIVDDTNFHPKHEARLREIAANVQTAFDRVVDFEVITIDTPLEECLHRDAMRPNSVGAKVIKRMWRDFVYVKPAPPKFDPSLDFAIICDIDGTIAIHTGRSPYDVEKCETDLVNQPISDVLHHFANDHVFFVSGREEKYMQHTLTWMRENGLTLGRIYMRQTGDMRSDDIVKQEIYDTHIKGKYNVRFVLDDRDRVVKMWRRNGLTCLQVAEGDF